MKDEQIRDLRIKSDLCFNLNVGLRRAITELELPESAFNTIAETMEILSAQYKLMNDQITFDIE